MASINLSPSGYTGLSSLTTSSSYPISNGYADIDSTAYARFSLSASTTGYLYYTFDTSDIPSTATVQSITAQAKVRVSNTSRVTSTVCQLYTGTTAKGSNTTFASTSSTNVVTLSCGTWTVSELSDLRMRIGATGSSSSHSKYIYFYGAEVTITYVTESRTVTVTLSGDGTVSPSGSNTVYDGDEFELTITPASSGATVTATQDGADITSQLVPHGAESTIETDLGAYTLVSGSFNGIGATYFSGLVGNGADATQTTANYYSGGSSVIAVFTYDMPFTNIPNNATIERVWCEVNGHAESTSNDSEYMCAMLISGSTELTEELNFKNVGTSNTTQTLECTTLPTVAQLAAMKLQCRLGYYGGAINGATCYVTYSTGSGVDHYTYTYTVSGNSTISVVIGGAAQDVMYLKLNGSWIEASKVYKKVNGSWAEQAALTDVFDPNVNYKYSG